MITAELLGTSRDQRQNLVIWIAFSKDGQPIQFYNNGQVVIFNGRPAWALVTRHEKLMGKTPQQRLQWIRVNVEDHIGNIIREIVTKDQLLSEVEAQLVSLVGQTIEKDTVSFEADLNNDGIKDATITLKDDGTYTVG